MSNPLVLARALIRETPPPPPPEQRKFAPQSPEEAWAFFGLTPYPHQRVAMNRDKRFLVDVWHRRAGKTTEKLLRLLFRAYWTPMKRARYAFLGPTYSQVQDIAWAELRSMAEAIPGAIIRESMMAIVIPTRIGDTARIRLYGVDSPKQRLRGSYLDGVVLDEWQHIPAHVWTQQVRPMLSDRSRACVDALGHRNQWANFIGTPLGRNHLYQFYTQARAWGRGEAVMLRDPGGGPREVRSDQWDGLRLTVEDTKVIEPSELEEIQATTPAVEYAQEYMCDFDAGVAGAIYRAELDAIKARGGIGDYKPNPYVPVHLCFDLGLNDMTVVWFFQRVGPWVVFIDVDMWTGAAIPTICKDILAKGYRLGTAYFPHDAHQRDAGTAKTRLLQYAEQGVRGIAVKKISLQDGIAATRRLLGRALFDRERCALGLDLLAIYRRDKDPTTGLPRSEPVHDEASHVADALRTGALGIPNWTSGGRRDSVAEM